jgi:transposase
MLGGDVSKGYADFCLMDGEGEILLEIQMDDTRQGHSQMRELIRECNRKVGLEEELEVALEATGGMERNWLHLFRKLDEADEADLNVYRFNPLVIRRFNEQRLHTNKTDEISARALANYLRLGLAEKKAAYTDEGPDDGLKTLSRKTQRMVNQSIDLQNEQQALLQRAHPELVLLRLRPHEPMGAEADKAVSNAGSGGRGRPGAHRDPVRHRGEGQKAR